MEKFSKIEWFVMIGCGVMGAAFIYASIWLFLALGSM
jgi:uncharacterized membrane protein YdcZ (DUF606 family)